jgi:hypothetical protein
MRKSIVPIILLMALFSTLMVSNASARSLALFDKPLVVSAFVSQTFQFSLQGEDAYDNETDINQMLFNFFMEVDYRPSQDWILYGSTRVVYDFIYPIKSDDDTWNEKKFDRSTDLRLDDEYWQLLHEAHVTWAPRGFLFRLGKQIVSWGEADFFRVMDQINPIDERRGFSDVEFESTIIPIWLWRAEYWPNVQTGWLEELGFQFVLNPNATWIPNLGASYGNEVGGIWSIAAEIPNPLFGLDPIFTPTTFLGGATDLVPEPDAWDDEFFDYSLRMTMMIYGNIVTLNGFYGMEKTFESLFVGIQTDSTGFPIFDMASTDGTTILFPIFQGFYPRKKFIGATWTGDLPWSISSLGGVNPTIRTEIRWQFDKVFTDNDQTFFFESNYLDSMIGVDWKVKWNLLNPRAYFTISPQFFWNRVISPPDNTRVFGHIHQDMMTVTLFLATSYMNGKIVPDFAFAYDIDNKAYLIIPSLSYLMTNNWHFSVNAAFHGGEEQNESLWVFRNKDYVAVKVKYNWQ